MKQKPMLVMGLATGLALLLPLAANAAVGISGSPHDFTTNTAFWVSGATNTWVPNGDVCSECHTIHNTKTPYSAKLRTAGPLWAHTLSQNTYVAYTSPNLTLAGYPNGGTPGWASIACLSCHDGSVAINAQNGSTVTGSTAVFVPSWAVVAVGGTDLSGTHPIGVDYNQIQGNAAVGPSFNVSSTPVANAGSDSGVQTIATELLFAENGSATPNVVECASCHDIHQRKGMSGTLKDSIKIGTATSITPLCQQCHIK